ncbi:5337_t:CDS:2 [Acaulospora morrowiae]|uniref:5337_t:CDS:1 n=1 Tax=Acaulospora morrowiae TaxID=94023 RepID=A0A9N9AL92_9GLOM|nr:5337_t:CDS:2 [Acaulospora morrowiae]
MKDKTDNRTQQEYQQNQQIVQPLPLQINQIAQPQPQPIYSYVEQPQPAYIIPPYNMQPTYVVEQQLQPTEYMIIG